ncbi:helix-turn-helix domain-containing protein [Clostridium tepidiprofundi]|uniref:helix-turn-helix domain-containing protein n=1 Tax=Clostridium tepidiprofundi TaxID=420412 RepID=UPI001FA7665E|nr:helix-turn-helix transcriptional regulator [Clostridium tepidiprofundi]
MYELMIKEYRLKKNLTQKELALALDISQSYLSEIENGKYDIKLSLLCKIANALDVLPAELFIYSKSTS